MGERIECRLIAPAKVNLGLSVGFETSSGRHPVETIMQTISLADELRVRIERDVADPGISIAMRNCTGVECDYSQLPPERNLIYRAIVEFARRIGAEPTSRFEIEVDKRIPAESGLGGGSSDCAAAIAMMAKLSELDLHGEVALGTARALGSDIAFFLDGGCALMGGFGEELVETFETPALDMVILRPRCGLSTGLVYREYDRISGADAAPSNLDPLASALRAGASASQLAPLMANDLQAAACAIEPDVSRTLDALALAPGVIRTMLSGSGSAVFAICDSAQSAEETARRATAHGLFAVAAHSVQLGAAVGEMRAIS
ncbi:MAG: 4-diphosphocytidyl-2C-methyl-D-erythritol kinase [Coriobacteriales bacterium]|nr:4-diphosphocytidyl-2C-methyl-D-erythritol kinase [Coriobacteriales bacterium]